MAAYNIDRFLTAQDWSYKTALEEIKRGRKESHWMWYIFPQIQGLGHSAVSILGEIDALKLRSSMTLFDLIAPNDVFAKVLEAFFNGERCLKTMERV